MRKKSEATVRSLKELQQTHYTLKQWERELVLGRKLDIAQFESLLRTFLGDCRLKLTDKRLGQKTRQEIKAYTQHWQLLASELKMGKGQMLFVVPEKIPVRASAPPAEALEPKAPMGYESPTDIIRKKLGWSVPERPSTSRLFSLETLPCSAPASILEQGIGGGTQ